jgi:hypothetical protein
LGLPNTKENLDMDSNGCVSTGDSDLGAQRHGLKYRRGGRSLRLVVALAVAIVPFVIAVPAAFAGVGLSVTPNFPSPVSNGQTNLPASVTITNLSNGAEASGTVTLSVIHLVPSCAKSGTGVNCPAAGEDPGVFQINSPVTGAAGSACAGDTFVVTVVDAATGELKLAPSSKIVLGSPNSPTQACVINFTFNVLKDPSKDFSTTLAGLQTEQIASANGTASDGIAGTGTGTNLITVADATAPSCNLTASIVGPPAQIQVTVQSSGPGLAAGGIVVTELTNATDTIGTYTAGTTTPVVVTATKTNQSLPAQLGLSVTDRNGNVTTCDPTQVSLVAGHGDSATQMVKHVARAEHLLTVFNGRPGIQTLVVHVNGHSYLLRLAAGQQATLDLAGALKAGHANTVKFTAGGAAGGSASILLHD